MMSSVVFHKSVTVPGVTYGGHISRLTSDEVWVNDVNNLVLTNTAGTNLHQLTDIDSGCGVHTVNSDGDLIYINRNGNINKLSKVDKVKSTLIKCTDQWKPACVYSSHSNEDLLVVMWNAGTYSAKVTRYNAALELIQTIQYDHNTGEKLYIDPGYITENRNGDIIVSDHDREAVVVTNRGGWHRFSYSGHPSGSGLLPFGICTNVLSQILVCDYDNNTIHMISKDGNFLSFILTQEQGLYLPQSLSYDEKNSFLWIGSGYNNTVVIYKCIDGESPSDLHLHDIKCKRHPRRTLVQFCIQCNFPLCVDCTSSEDHRGHHLGDIEELFKEIHRIEDGDTFLMCLLLSNSYKINLKEGNWMTKYNTVANSFQSKEIKKPFALKDLEKYKPILKFNELEISFSNELFKNISFLRFSKNLKFLDIFLAWAEKENIAEYCRSCNYQREEGEVCCWLLPEKNEEFLERLGENIFTHPTMNDQSIHEAVFRKFGVPIQVIMRGDKSVKNFTENLKKGRTRMYHASGMIIGCAGSGKTTLLERLKGTDLAEIKQSVNSTRGVQIHTDVFNVTDSIRVNNSSQQQRFKIRVDEANDVEKLEKVEPVAVGYTTAEASILRQVSPEGIKIQTTSSYKREDPTSSENSREVLENSEAFSSASELSGVLQILSKNNSNDPEKKITMTDFAGQCAYYASHQIFLSPRAFFILVLNMEKKFEDKVGEEVCRQKGSIYKEWTHKDYLKFWMESIHQYSSIKAPVILIGTHSEDKEERDITLFFREIWKILEIKKSLHKELVKRRFAVGFHDKESLENIKKSIVDVVYSLEHWGEDLPQSWAMFETFFREKKKDKFLNRDDIIAFNEALPEGIRLHTSEDMKVMLQFFHDTREILYFDQDVLNKVIILDVQWFADAFKNVITDKNHAEEDLFEFATEWDNFNETGELHDTLLSAIWKMHNKCYIEQKDHIMMYMEKLGLLAKICDNKWYVPCMNKKSFPVPDDEPKASKSKRGYKHAASESPASIELLTEVQKKAKGLHNNLVAELITDYLDESVEG
ncbi:uncharacterized protein LOC134241223, partial [Saccostrea cucullata]|uniref:uncharacterized protein LOC134241223 n=1 Tax=Saccostrea cuccullata TaxID=36930 RepID=UPI002ED293DD